MTRNVYFDVIAGRLTSFLTSNTYIYTLVQKAHLVEFKNVVNIKMFNDYNFYLITQVNHISDDHLKLVN